MKKYLIWTVIFIVAVILSVIIGNYSGGALYLYLAGTSASNVTWDTLYNGVHLPYKHPDFSSAIWGSVLAAWIVFIPVLITVVTIWLFLLPKNKSLYGNARFATNKEMEVFHYKGDYN